MTFSTFFILVLLFLQASSADDKAGTVTITTPSGKLKGLKRKSIDTRSDIYEFRGIPYAKPPIGNRRFMKPEPFGKWTDTLDATIFGNVCPQLGVEFLPNASKLKVSEDCLVLNVYVPKVLDSGKTLSVMVWIHGGGFIMGCGNQFSGERIAIEGNVIVVTFNYRLNIFGFLALNHPASLGNYGLWDQILALQWIHDNIESFGGNPNSVTLFGESAGGWSASYHSLIPSNKGRFQRAIAQSGAISRTSMTRTKSIENNIKLISNITNCPVDNLDTFADCLRAKSVDELLSTTTESFFSHDKILHDLVYQPVIDADLFKDHPMNRLEVEDSEEAKFFASIDVMTGITSHVGSILYVLIPTAVQNQYNFNVSEEIPLVFLCEGLISPYVKTFYKNNPQIKEQMCKFYNTEESSTKQSMRAVDFYTDSLFLYPATKMLQFHSSLGGTSYQYQFTKISPIQVPPPPTWYEGCSHADELIYFFDDDAMFRTGDVQFTKEEKELSKNLIKYWTSFAKTGDPNGDDTMVKWEQYHDTTRYYLNFDNQINSGTNLKSDTIKFWSEQLPTP